MLYFTLHIFRYRNDDTFVRSFIHSFIRERRKETSMMIKDTHHT